MPINTRRVESPRRGVLRRVRLSSAFLAFVIIFSIVAAQIRDESIQISKNQGARAAEAFAFSAPLMAGVGFFRDINPLNQSTRLTIYEYVRDNPGIHLRGICSGLGLSVGAVQYHLQYLTRKGLLSSRRHGRCKRYFDSGRYTENAMRIISLLRHRAARKILESLLEGKNVSHGVLAARLGMSSQALTWQMGRLRKALLIDCISEGTRVRYLVREENIAEVRKHIALPM